MMGHETKLAQLRTMFPRTPAGVIDEVLRGEQGDVGIAMYYARKPASSAARRVLRAMRCAFRALGIFFSRAARARV
jgi:hypothetical protein